MNAGTYLWRLAVDATAWSIWPSRVRVAMLRALGIAVGEGAIIASGVFIGSRAVSIGPRALIGMNCFLDGSASVTIGEEVTLGPFCCIISGTHAIQPGRNRRGDAPTVPRSVHVGAGSWLGAQVTLVCASVGEGCVVGAGTVVDRDVPANELVKGARVVERRPLPQPGDQL